MECDPLRCSHKPRIRIPLKIEENLAGIAIGLLALITFANVLVRYFTNISFAFTEEYSIFLMVLMAFLGGSSVMAKQGHLNIVYFVDKLPARSRRMAQIGAAVVTGVTFLVLAILGARMAWDEYRFEVTSPGLGVPTFIYTMWMPILSLVICARTIGVILRLRKGP